VLKKQFTGKQFDLLQEDADTLDFLNHTQWINWLNNTLPKPDLNENAPLAIDLFAGCGGLALGFEAAGIRTHGFEMNRAASETYSSNLHGNCDQTTLVVGYPCKEERPVDLIIGGPPCQPFSQNGHQKGMNDTRDGFPIFVDALKRMRPKIAIIENVRGLLFRNRDYLGIIAQQIEQIGYFVDAKIINARDYGTPQNRERVFIVAHQGGWQWPAPVVSNYVTSGIALSDTAGCYVDDTRILTASMDRYIAEYEKKSHCKTPRDLHLNKPARTLTCRNFGAATGDMHRILLPNGQRRMLSIREGARLQGFPDWFEFSGSRAEQTYQIGNAVSPLVSYALAKQARILLEKNVVARSPNQNANSGSLLQETPIQIKTRQAQTILKAIGVDIRSMTPMHKNRTAWALLAVAHLRPQDAWSDAKSYLDDGITKPLSQREILKYWNAHYETQYADSSYDDVKRKNLIHLEAAGLVQASSRNPEAAINDPTRGHSLTSTGLKLLHTYGTPQWDAAVEKYTEDRPSLRVQDETRRKLSVVKISTLDGQNLEFSAGAHNDLIKACVEQFLGRFAHGSQVLFLADAAKKKGYDDRKLYLPQKFLDLKIPEFKKGQKLVDIVAYSSEKNWLYLIEAVHSSNPLTPLRHEGLKKHFQNSNAGRVYVTAFNSRKDFKKWAADVSWETEVWIAEEPDHLIHFNGNRFLGPHDGDKGSE
jgi:site-specific DNA-cytosine methylase